MLLYSDLENLWEGWQLTQNLLLCFLRQSLWLLKNGLDNAKFITNSWLLNLHTGNNFGWFSAHSDLVYWKNLHIISKSHQLLLWITVQSLKPLLVNNGCNITQGLTKPMVHVTCMWHHTPRQSQRNTQKRHFYDKHEQALTVELHTCMESLQSWLSTGGVWWHSQ